MILRLQDPEALDQVKQEMKKLQDLGFIKKVKDLPQDVQDELEKDFKHYIPTTIAYKETSASTKTWICWDIKRIGLFELHIIERFSRIQRRQNARTVSQRSIRCQPKYIKVL